MIKLIVLESGVIIKIFISIKNDSDGPMCIEFTIYNFQFIHKDCEKGGIIVLSISRQHEHNGFTVSGKLCLNLSSCKWLKPSRNL